MDGESNSLPVAAKSSQIIQNGQTGLKYIPFWDNPMIGSVFRADGFPRAQTRQIGPFHRAIGFLRANDQGTEGYRLDSTRTGQATP